ncbi:formate dehydrogenase subunit delta [Methylophilus aquaticus]|uniref:Formate dehydrogenase subunit delta n=1 Tax=Methylophilus aquaticus TaxID=1971610 RepID=A0ABT9JTJ8_9PROT|nr:formate dehydrogenase subunit delta [Methylophilus aquaticus]MDP8567461.1 formate dehydrogenase subunit delta [Methylophilus aquaticus]
MDIEKLIKMANQIGDFFEANPDAEDAKLEIAGHLKKFWNSVMIKAIVAHVQQQQGAGLHPRVVAAIQQHVSV